MNKWAMAAMILGVLVIVAFITDCTAGDTRVYACMVREHNYVPSWIEVHTDTDSEGRTHITTEHHPEEFHLIMEDRESDRAFEINVSHTLYITLNDGASADVVTRVGRWTKIDYAPWIRP